MEGSEETCELLMMMMMMLKRATRIAATS